MSGCTGPTGGDTEGCLGCPRFEDSLWAVLDDEDLATLSASREIHAYAAGDVIAKCGEPSRGIHCLQSGEVAITRVDDAGNAIVTSLAGPAAAIGYRAFFSGRPQAASVRALTDCTTCLVPAPTLRQVLARSRTLASAIAAHAVSELEDADDARLRQAFLPVRSRLAHLLLCLRERHGTVGDDGTLEITLPLSRQDIAAVIGTTPETVARTIHALQDEGVASFDGRIVRISDLDLVLDDLERVGLS